MKAVITRNKETNEFACMLGSYELARGKSGPMVAKVHDMAELVNAAIEVGYRPQVLSDGRGVDRRFTVVWGDAVLASGMSATGAYRLLDAVESVIETERSDQIIEMAKGSSSEPVGQHLRDNNGGMGELIPAESVE